MGLISRILIGVGPVIGSLFSKQAADEFKAWTPWLVSRLIQRAAKKYPEHQERLIEEWSGRAFDIPGEVGKLYFAICLQFNGENLRLFILERLFALAIILLFLPVIITLIIPMTIVGGRPYLRRFKTENGKYAYKFDTKGSFGVALKSTSLDELPLLIYCLVYGNNGTTIAKSFYNIPKNLKKELVSAIEQVRKR